MNEHVTASLEAYHDGELAGRRLEQVEAHLAQCASCRAELHRLQSLAVLLRESPTPRHLTPPDRFVGQVGLRLPRQPELPAWRRMLRIGWQAAPLGLFGAWAFVQAAFLVAGVVLIAAQLGFGGDLAANLLPAANGGAFSPSVSGLSDIGSAALSVLSGVGLLGWGFALDAALTAVIAVLYWSWLASWWVRMRPHRA